MALPLFRPCKAQLQSPDPSPGEPDWASSSGAGAADRRQKNPKSSRREGHSWTTVTLAPYDDGHQWRKYGEKRITNSMFPRYYYRCTYKGERNCPATKLVQQKDSSDPPFFVVTYKNKHTCGSSPITSPALFPVGSPPGQEVVLIGFSSCGTKEQPSFLPSPAAGAHAVSPREARQPVRPSSQETMKAETCAEDEVDWELTLSFRCQR